MEENVLILGATSDMAVAIARKLAGAGYSLTLAGRNAERLSALAGDLRVRHKAMVNFALFDALDFQGHEAFYDSLPEKPDIVICVFGMLGDQREAERSWNHSAAILHSNFTGAVSILNVVANDFERRKKGVIVGVSSVAGERGRQSNYIYGSAKAGFSAYLSGLRNRLYHHGVHVLTVKPGFVKTKMIENISTPAVLTASPKQVADKVLKAIVRRKDTLYVLPAWAFIMSAIKAIPEGMFKKMKL
ncbi:MAG TPA: SDR family oxidoreductase [Chryseosolibacter sp.]|jgi:short-subunit dehydrogenase|nr:SDR family oxidoreductase [Chryseosolibacter sp.]